MPNGNGLLRIFWPLDAPRSKKSGVLIGWRNAELDLFVVSVLQDVDPRQVESALRLGRMFRGSPHVIERLLNLCGNAQLHVLGVINPAFRIPDFDPLQIQLFLEPRSILPQISCPRDHKISAQIVLYHKPDPVRMQYMSLDPISLALSGHLQKHERLRANSEAQPKSHLIQKLRLHTVVQHRPSQKDVLLPTILGQINCSSEMARLLSKNIGLISLRQTRKLSVSDIVVESASNIWDYILSGLWYFFRAFIYPLITQLLIFAIICHRIVAEVLLRVLEWRPRVDSAALKDVSATAQQVDIRLQQFCYWPIQYATLRRRREDWDSVTDSHPDYIRYYNSLWLVANDVIIGIALGSYIIENAEWVAFQLNHMLSDWTLQGLKDIIIWLTDWPAGLKLNNELASFLGDLFLWVIEYWSHCVESLQPFLPQIIFFVGFSSFAGASMPIALFSDLLSLLTLHIYSFYMASARIYHWQLTIIISLFHLFRGKKHNVLRNRIDSCDYDLDQLLLGTILFTLLVFLLPTVVVFYLTFAFARVVIISLKAGLDTMLACLNHFPLFALMLRLKDSRRLPGGIRFDLQDTPSVSAKILNDDDTPQTSCVILKSVPLSLRQVLDQYFSIGGRIKEHYLSIHVLLYLLTGRFVPPIHRKNLYSLQYSMLPVRRADIREVIRCLNETRPKQGSNGVPKPPNGLQPRRTR